MIGYLLDTDHLSLLERFDVSIISHLTLSRKAYADGWPSPREPRPKRRESRAIENSRLQSTLWVRSR
jgi:hypothetical protein